MFYLFSQVLNKPYFTYSEFKNYLQISVVIIKALEEKFKMNNMELYLLLNNLFCAQHMDFPDIMHKNIPKNLCLLATTNSKSFSFSPVPVQFPKSKFSSYKFFIKCGSPGFNAFIEEVLVLPKSDGINLERIKNYAFQENDLIVKPPTYKSKSPNCLEIMNFSSFGDIPKIQLFNPIPNVKSLKNVLPLIGFKLYLNLKKQHSNLLNDNSSIEPEIISTSDVINSSSEENSICYEEEDRSESDARLASSDSDFENNEAIDKQTLIGIYRFPVCSDWNETINAKVSFPIYGSFNRRIIEVVFDQMNKHLVTLIQNHPTYNEFTNRFRFSFNMKLTPEEEKFGAYAELEVFEWLGCFMEYWHLNPYTMQFVYQIGYFMYKSDIPDSKIQEFFFLSMNVADQLITPNFYNDQATFIPDRLKKRVQVPKLIADANNLKSPKSLI